MNILVKTTFNRSPGDDLARRGVKSLLAEHIKKHNVFVYDAGKDMSDSVRNTLRRNKRIQTDIWHVERSARIDLVIFAGSPVWTGKELVELEDYIVENSVPCYYLGVGTNSSSTERTGEVLKNCKLFIARDDWALETSAKYGVEGIKICCPSIFSFVPIRAMVGEKIGIVVQMDTKSGRQLDLINRFDKDRVRIIAHHIEDYEFLVSVYGGSREIRYSRFIDDLAEMYKGCHSIYSMRVHGAHLAFSLCIPTICLKEKKKSKTCECLGVKVKFPTAFRRGHLISRSDIVRNRVDLRRKYISALRGLYKRLS